MVDTVSVISIGYVKHIGMPHIITPSNFVEKDEKTKSKFKGEILTPEISHPETNKASTDNPSPSQPRISYADAVRKKADGKVSAVNRTVVGV